jgi:hypothetical protein
MKSKRLLDKIAGAFITAAMTVFMFGIAILWLTNNEEEFDVDDSSTVTIEYNCWAVMAEPQEFPLQVVSECSQKPIFTKKSNKTTL